MKWTLILVQWKHIQQVDHTIVIHPFKQTKMSKSYFNRVNYFNEFISHMNTLLKDTFHLHSIDFNKNYIIDSKCGSGINILKQQLNIRQTIG
mgnify:CR=1 FL=1